MLEQINAVTNVVLGHEFSSGAVIAKAHMACEKVKDHARKNPDISADAAYRISKSLNEHKVDQGNMIVALCVALAAVIKAGENMHPEITAELSTLAAARMLFEMLDTPHE